MHNKILKAFSDQRPYAICSFAGAWVLLLLHPNELPQWIEFVSAAAAVTALRDAAVALDWRPPRWKAGSAP